MAHPLWIVLPVPAETKVQVKDKDNPKEERKPLDDYVKDFVMRHGYRITISHSSSKKCNICHYVCHRGGNPPRPKPIDPSSTDSQPPPLTRSIKIRCPFRLTAKFEDDSWTLRHVRLGHNHRPTNDSDNNLLNQMPEASPPIVLPPEIDSRIIRIQQLSPNSQNIVLMELDMILDQRSANNSSKGPTTTNAAGFNQQALVSTLQFLNESDKGCTEGIHVSNNIAPRDKEIPTCQAPVDAENKDTAREHTKTSQPPSTVVETLDAIEVNPTPVMAAVSPIQADHPTSVACVNSSGTGDEDGKGQVVGDNNIRPVQVIKRATPSKPSTRKKVQKLDKSNVPPPQIESVTAPRTTRSRTQKRTSESQSSRITRKKS